MIASAHLVAGAVAGLAGARVAGEKWRGVAVAFLLGIVSHHILDAIPHSDYSALSPIEIRVVGVGEIIVTLTAIVLAARGRLSRGQLNCLFAGVVGGAVMDVKFLMPLFPGRYADGIQRIQDVLHPFHAAVPASRTMGLALELSLLAVCSVLLALQIRLAFASRSAGGASRLQSG